MPLKLIQRNGTGNYYLRGSVAGTKVYASTHTSDRQAAENIRIRTEAQLLERASLGRKATVTFAEAALNYMNAGGEARFLAPILRHFGPNTKLSEIDNATVSTAAESLYPTAQPATVNRQLITPISAILAMAAEDGLCTPVKLRRRKVTTQKTRWLTPEEFEALAKEMTPHLTQIVGFMIGTGARVSETLNLQASTLYLSTGQAMLNKTKNGHPRMVRFPARAAHMMQVRELPTIGSVFTTDHGKRYETGRILANGKRDGASIKTAFNRARDAAGLDSTGPDKVTPHTIRHTWATWHYAQNRDFGALLDLGGWSSADVANIYRKIAPDDLAGRLLQHGWDFRHAGRLDPLETSPLRSLRQT
ncbi:tyrosine-type recombinase/integrase [Rhodobacteraceae bacterium R_SAG3]|nr:tyrosine-type recombinase/integrase [Rhodobacteraceae bacterium R_SAG3]